MLHVGIELGFVVAGDGDGFVIYAGSLCCVNAQTGLAHVDVGELKHVGAQNAAEAVSCSTGNGLGAEAGGDVCGGAHGRPVVLAGDEILYHCAVAHGIDILVVGAHGSVNIEDPCTLNKAQTGVCQPFGVGTGTDGYNDHIGLDGALAGADLLHLSIALEAHNAVAQEGGDALVGRAIGDTLAKYGFTADICPEKYTSRNLAAEIEKHWNGGEIFLLHSNDGSKPLYDRLNLSLRVRDIPIYTVARDERIRFGNESVD